MIDDVPEPPIEIVVVEDKREDRESIVAALCDFVDQVQIAEFPSDLEAGEFVDWLSLVAPPSHADSLRLILLDFHINGHTVLPLLDRVRACPVTRHIPAVIFSDSNETDTIRRCYEHGASAFVVKPVNFQAFAGAIRNIAGFWLETNRL